MIMRSSVLCARILIAHGYAQMFSYTQYMATLRCSALLSICLNTGNRLPRESDQTITSS